MSVAMSSMWQIIYNVEIFNKYSRMGRCSSRPNPNPLLGASLISTGIWYLYKRIFFVNTLPELYPATNQRALPPPWYCMDCAHIYTYEKHVNQKINYKIFRNLNNVYNMALILLKQKLTNCSSTMGVQEYKMFERVWRSYRIPKGHLQYL